MVGTNPANKIPAVTFLSIFLSSSTDAHSAVRIGDPGLNPIRRLADLNFPKSNPVWDDN